MQARPLYLWVSLSTFKIIFKFNQKKGRRKTPKEGNDKYLALSDLLQLLKDEMQKQLKLLWDHQEEKWQYSLC